MRDFVREELEKDGPVNLIEKQMNMEIFENLDLTFSCFEGANLQGAKFINCNLSESIFNRCNLINVEFENCNLLNADFVHSDLFGVKFKDTDVTTCNFSFAKGNCKSVKSIHAFEYPLVYTKNKVYIGVISLPIDEFFSNGVLGLMEKEAVKKPFNKAAFEYISSIDKFLSYNSGFIKEFINRYPAL